MKAILSNRPIMIAALAIVAVLAVLFLRPNAQDSPVAVNPILLNNVQANITAPADGSQVSDHSTTIIEGFATSPENIISLELWVNGILAHVLAAPQGGQDTFAAEYLWQPQAPGQHSLVLKAFDSSGQTAFSQITRVQVNAYEYGVAFTEDAADGNPSVVAIGPSSQGASPLPAAPSSPGPSVDIAQSQPWQGSDEGAPADLIPAAPSLSVRVEDCSVNLAIQDLSDNEEGFAVYRQTQNSPAWQQIALLSAQSASEWIGYTDAGLPGNHTYYVSAFNAAGDASGNLALASVDPGDCPVSDTQAPILTIQLTSLRFDMPVEKSYCYRSIAGQPWQRWPARGFFELNEDGGLADRYALTSVVPALFDENQSEGNTIKWDCWGWVEGNLQNLGEISSPPFDPNDFGQILMNGHDFQMGVVLDFFDKDIFPDLSDFLPDVVDPNMVEINSHISSDFEECKNQLINHGLDYYNADNPDEYWAGICIENGSSSPGDLGVKFNTPVPQHYVIWDFIGDICLPLAPFPDNCKTHDEWLNGDLVPGFGVVFSVELTEHYDLNPVISSLAPTHQWPAKSFMWRSWREAQTEYYGPCENQRAFTLRLMAEIYSEGETYEIWSHDASNPHVVGSFPCKGEPNQALLDAIEEAQEAAPTGYAIMQVTFDTLTLDMSDDDDDFDAQETLELFGWFRAMAPNAPIDNFVPVPVRLYFEDQLGPAVYRNESYISIAYNIQHPDCPDDIDPIGSAGPVEFCPPRVSDGTYQIADWPTCLGNEINCKEKKLGGQASIVLPIMTNNNVLGVIALDDKPLWIEVGIQDWDDGSLPDPACYGSLQLSARPVADWFSILNQPFSILGTGVDGGQCVVNGVISSVGQ